MSDPSTVLRVLVVDDEPGICLLLKEALTLQGAHVEVAHNRSGAMALINQQPFDLAFIDLTLPDSRGYEIIRDAKALHPDMVGIIMSGAAVDSFPELIEHQIDDYIHKPFSLEEVAYLVARHRWTRFSIDAGGDADMQVELEEVAHQLKTPLAVIKEFCYLLEEGNGGHLLEKQQTYLDVIQDNVDLALQQVRHLEQLHRSAVPEASLDLGALEIGELIEQILTSWQPVMKRQGLKLQVTPAENIPPVFADRSVAAQIIYNLLDNASKYAPAGSVVLLKTHVEDGNTVSVVVEDEGSGIPDDQREFIFRPYGRLPDHVTSPGLGLGLTIALRLARQMGGDLVLGETRESGTRFILRLPVAEKV